MALLKQSRAAIRKKQPQPPPKVPSPNVLKLDDGSVILMLDIQHSSIIKRLGFIKVTRAKGNMGVEFTDGKLYIYPDRPLKEYNSLIEIDSKKESIGSAFKALNLTQYTRIR